MYKWLGLVAFVLTGVAGHTQMLPAALQPWHEWVEFGGFVGSLVRAYLMLPGNAERALEKHPPVG